MINGDLIGKIILLKSGIKGKCIFQLASGEYGLQYEKGGRIECFKEEDVLEVNNKK